MPAAARQLHNSTRYRGHSDKVLHARFLTGILSSFSEHNDNEFIVKITNATLLGLVCPNDTLQATVICRQGSDSLSFLTLITRMVIC